MVSPTPLLAMSHREDRQETECLRGPVSGAALGGGVAAEELEACYAQNEEKSIPNRGEHQEVCRGTVGRTGLGMF